MPPTICHTDTVLSGLSVLWTRTNGTGLKQHQQVGQVASRHALQAWQGTCTVSSWEACTVHHLNSDADRALFGPFEKAMLPLWLSMKSALDLVATLEPGDAVLAGILAVLQHM